MTELIWDGKYDASGKRIAPVRLALPFQTVETVNESAQQRQLTLDLFSQGRDPEWRNRLCFVRTLRGLGILPEQRAFEYRTETAGVIRGKIDMPQPSEELAQLNRNWVQRDSSASFRKRDILRQGHVYRQAYFLPAINPPDVGTT